VEENFPLTIEKAYCLYYCACRKKVQSRRYAKFTFMARL